MQEAQETWVWSLGQEDPLEEGTATPSSVLAWSISWTEEPGGLQSMGLRRVRTEETENAHSWARDVTGATELWALVTSYVLGDFPSNLRILTHWIFIETARDGYYYLSFLSEETEA